MNPISPEVLTGTIGELLVQIRLLQYGVQAAPPVKDSGNDLIAVRGNVFKALQVKTTTTGIFAPPRSNANYHILAVVMLNGEGNQVQLDQSEVFLIPKEKVGQIPRRVSQWDKTQFGISKTIVERLFVSARGSLG